MRPHFCRRFNFNWQPRRSQPPTTETNGLGKLICKFLISDYQFIPISVLLGLSLLSPPAVIIIIDILCLLIMLARAKKILPNALCKLWISCAPGVFIGVMCASAVTLTWILLITWGNWYYNPPGPWKNAEFGPGEPLKLFIFYASAWIIKALYTVVAEIAKQYKMCKSNHSIKLLDVDGVVVVHLGMFVYLFAMLYMIPAFLNLAYILMLADAATLRNVEHYHNYTGPNIVARILTALVAGVMYGALMMLLLYYGVGVPIEFWQWALQPQDVYSHILQDLGCAYISS